MVSLITKLAMIFLIGTSFPGMAAEREGVRFPDEVQLAGKSLKLNGLGVRKAKVLFISARVYVAALYLEKPSRDSTAILDSAELKKIEMRFLRSVGREKISDAWKDSFNKNCGKEENCQALKPSLKKLQAWMPDELKEGNTLTFHFLLQGVEVLLNGKNLGRIDDKAYGRVLLATWLGPNPPNEELKEGLLGQAEE